MEGSAGGYKAMKQEREKEADKIKKEYEERFGKKEDSEKPAGDQKHSPPSGEVVRLKQKEIEMQERRVAQEQEKLQKLKEDLVVMEDFTPDSEKEAA